MELLIDGNLRKTTYLGNLDYSWDVRAVKAGIHEIKVRAIDNHNNIRVKVIKVQVQQ